MPEQIVLTEIRPLREQSDLSLKIFARAYPGSEFVVDMEKVGVKRN